MPKDSIRLPIILLVLERIRSESQIWKITGHGYRAANARRMIHGWWLFSAHSSHSPHLYIWLWNSITIDGALLVLRQVCQKCSEPEVWITELELSGLCVQLCRVHRPLFQSPTRKLLCFYCWPDAYGCNFIYFAVYLFYSIKQQRAWGVLHASENFDRLDMHRCWWIWSISYSLFLCVSLSLHAFPLSLRSARIYPRYPIPIILRQAIPGRLVESRSRIRSMQNRRFVNKRICRSDRY